MSGIYKIAIVFFSLFIGQFVYAQNKEVVDSTLDEEEVTDVLPMPDGKYKIGLKLGVLGSTISGEENTNNTIKFGLSGGAYLRRKFKSEKWGFQIELNGSFRGSNYEANDTNYSSIRLVCLDVPLYLFFNLTKNEDHKIILGPQFSYLLSSALYKNQFNLPESKPPKLVEYDILACGGYHYRLGHIAIQTMFKYGFVNINNGLLPNITPANQGKSMHNLIFEVNLLF
ncbi:MAG: outer membrane beta-barrel protein [Bacteroidota bacterium]